MTRGRLVLSFLLFVALCASIAYWGLQLYDPPLRPVAAGNAGPKVAAPRLEAAASVFGGQGSAVPVLSNLQLRGVIVSGTPQESIAILSVEGKPPKAYRASAEVVPGLTIKEVHRQYVLLADGGTIKRIELPAAARAAQQNGIAARAPIPTQPMPSASIAQSPPAVQSAPAENTTVVIEQEQTGQSTPVSDEQAPDPEAVPADTEGAAAGSAEPADPAQMQANPPQR